MKVRIRISRRAARQINRDLGPRKRWGGFQHLYGRLQEGLRFNSEEGYSLTMTVDDAETVERYAVQEYGPGGFQTPLREILPDVRQALASVNRDMQGELPFDE